MTVQDGSTFDGSVLTADVCIVGGGPAGIVLSAELARADVDVLVVEAGGAFYDRHDSGHALTAAVGHAAGAQSGTRGWNIGRPYFPLRMSRIRGLGGSTAALKPHGLRARPLDPIDFEETASGRWPIEYDEYSRFVPAAAAYCGLPGDGAVWDDGASHDPFAGSSQMHAVEFRHGPRSRFGELSADAVVDQRQRWVTGATATDLHVDSEGSVESVRFATGSSGSFVVEARTVVLACGGLDNARVLLANESVLTAMGSAADHVGNSFMEHLHYVAGHIVPSGEEAHRELTTFFGDSEERWLTVSDQLVTEERLARSAFAGLPAYSSSLNHSVNAFGRLMRALPYGPMNASVWRKELRSVVHGIPEIGESFRQRLSSEAERDCFVVGAMSEQVPHTQSRLMLSTRRDRWGVPLPVLDWQFAEVDLQSARRSAAILGEEISAAGFGDFVSAWGRDNDQIPSIGGGWHHMGTTRMGASPAESVVDTDGAVHGIENLFVAGSSVFPTGGFANPTLSLVALAIRLAEHLADRDA